MQFIKKNYCILEIYIIFDAHTINNNDMATIAQLVSEIAHSVKQADSVAARRAIKLGIIHARNELIRHSYSNHNYTDKVLQQRFRVALIDVPDGDLADTEDLGLKRIKRTAAKVPRPVRLTNNLPFHSVRTAGVNMPVVIPFVKEATAQFYKELIGMCNTLSYDYINDYIYINTIDDHRLSNINSIIVESVFEYPHIIETETVEGKLNIDEIDDNDEFLLPEDMISGIKKIVLETWNGGLNGAVIRDTNEVPSINIVK